MEMQMENKKHKGAEEGEEHLESKKKSRKGESIEEIEDCRIGSVPAVFYVSDFISDQEEHQLLNHIYKAPVAKWKVLKNRRLQSWGGIVHEKGLLAQDLPPWLTTISRKIFNMSGLFPSPINHVLINEYLSDQGIMPHQDGPAYNPVVAILSLGSPVVMDFTPHLSLQVQGTEDTDTGGCNQMSLDESLKKHQPFSVLLMPRSLLIFKDEIYSDYLHGIKDSEYQQLDQVVNMNQVTRGRVPSVAGSGRKITEGDKLIHRTCTRISLTCRTVTKVHKTWLKV